MEYNNMVQFRASANKKENKSNKVSNWNNPTTDSTYPTEKLVKDSLDGKQEELVSGTNLKTLNGVDLLGEGNIAIDVAISGCSTVLFEDSGSAEGISNYSTAHILETGGTTTFTLTWDTTQNAYHIQTNPSKASMISIGALDGYTGDFKLEADIMRTSTSYFGGLCYCQKEKYGFIYGLGSSKFMGHHYANGRWLGELNPTGSSSLNTWYHMELVKESDTITISVYDSTGVTLLASTSKTYGDDENYFGISMSNFYFKNVKAETIGGDSENTIYLGDDIMTMIDTALGHMITNWQDYE